MKQTIGGTTYEMVYGSKENKELVSTLGLDVMMIPRLCVKLQPFQRNLLHMEDGWTTKKWPFLTISIKEQASLIPFEHYSQGRFDDLVFVFPKGFMCDKFLPDWPRRMETLRKDGVTVRTRAYDDCDHVMFHGLTVITTTAIIDLLLEHSCPAIVTLKQKN